MHTSLPYSSHRSTSLQGSVLATWVVLTVVARGVVVTTLVVLCVVVPESPTITQTRYYKDPRSSVATDSLFLLLDWPYLHSSYRTICNSFWPTTRKHLNKIFFHKRHSQTKHLCMLKKLFDNNTDNLLIKCRIRSHYDF